MRFEPYRMAVGLAVSLVLLATAEPWLVGPLLAKKARAAAELRSRRFHQASTQLDRDMLFGDLKSAEADAHAVLALSPKSPYAQSLLAEIYFREGRKEDSRALYRKIILNPRDVTSDPKVHMRFARLSEAAGFRDDAEIAYSRVIADYAGVVDSHLVNGPWTHLESFSDFKNVAVALDAWRSHHF